MAFGDPLRFRFEVKAEIDEISRINTENIRLQIHYRNRYRGLFVSGGDDLEMSWFYEGLYRDGAAIERKLKQELLVLYARDFNIGKEKHDEEL